MVEWPILVALIVLIYHLVSLRSDIKSGQREAMDRLDQLSSSLHDAVIEINAIGADIERIADDVDPDTTGTWKAIRSSRSGEPPSE